MWTKCIYFPVYFLSDLLFADKLCVSSAGPFPNDLESQHEQSVLDQDAKKPPDSASLSVESGSSTMTPGSEETASEETPTGEASGEETPTEEAPAVDGKKLRSSMLSAEGLRIHGKGKRRLSVTFADQVYQFSYHHFPTPNHSTTVKHAEKEQMEKDVEVPGSINSSPTLVDDASDQEAEEELIVADEIIDVGLKDLSHQKVMLLSDPPTIHKIEQRPQLKQSVSEPAVQTQTAAVRKQKSLATRPDVLMLSIMWLAYFGYWARFSVA